MSREDDLELLRGSFIEDGDCTVGDPDKVLTLCEVLRRYPEARQRLYKMVPQIVEDFRGPEGMGQ